MGDDGLEVVTGPQGDGSRVLQAVWTDSTGRSPRHRAHADPSTVQRLRGSVPVEVLSLPCPDVPPSPAALELEERVVTTQAVLDRAAVTAVRHGADGGW